MTSEAKHGGYHSAPMPEEPTYIEPRDGWSGDAACVSGDDYEAIWKYARFVRSLLAQREEEIDRLGRLVYVPGILKCAKCKLTLVSNTIDASRGLFKANNEPQQCPNGCGPLWRLTERDSGNELCDRLERAETKLERMKKP